MKVNNAGGSSSSSNRSSSTKELLFQDLHRQRELLFSFLSILSSSFLLLFWYSNLNGDDEHQDYDLVQYIRKYEELPSSLIIYLSVVELFKVWFVLYMFQTSDYLLKKGRRRNGSLKNSSSSSGGSRRRSSKRRRLELGDKNDEGDDEYDVELLDDMDEELPKLYGLKIRQTHSYTVFGKQDDDDDNEEGELRNNKVFSRHRNNFLFKVMEFIKGILTFVLSVGICYIFVVLFGAPILIDKMLTLQFSFILVTLLFLPLCVYVRPASVLHEVIFMRIWDTNIGWVQRTLLRFAVTLFGTMCGAAAFPLDWDRPWQRWPIPCLVSMIISYFIFHCLCFICVLGLIYGPALKQFFGFRQLSKVKVY